MFLSSGLLLGLSWPFTGGITPLVFFALVPFLLAEEYIYQRKLRPRKVFWNSYLLFITFNFVTTWWVYYASSGGMLMAVFLNSLLMAIVFWLYHLVRRKLGNQRGYIALVLLWLGFEWCHYHWELSWPWLSFGNVFANRITWVQWYEYTGVLGGSLWVLLVNIQVFFLAKKIFFDNEKIGKQKRKLIQLSCMIGIPIAISLVMYFTYEEALNPINVVVVQPNIDPYFEKFDDGLSSRDQLDRITKLAAAKIDETIDYVVAPETAIARSLMESDLQEYTEVDYLSQFVVNTSKASLVIGLSSHQVFDYEVSDQAKRLKNGDFYENYNSAMLLDHEQHTQLYHKSELVLGAEKMPFAWLLKPLEGLALDLGGTFGTLGVEAEAKNLINHQTGLQVAPIICYESVYGDYVSDFVKKGAQVLFIITNDGWWDDTPGYKQHLSFASLRAIETRRSIARSANTGTSCFVNQKGEILQPTKWWVQDAIKGSINANAKLTFYTKHGDIIGRVSFGIGVMLLLFALVTGFNVSMQSYE